MYVLDHYEPYEFSDKYLFSTLENANTYLKKLKKRNSCRQYAFYYRIFKQFVDEPERKIEIIVSESLLITPDDYSEELCEELKKKEEDKLKIRKERETKNVELMDKKLQEYEYQRKLIH